MDDRKPPSGFQNLQAKKSVKPISNATLYATFLSAFLGCLFISAFFYSNKPNVQFTFFFSFFLIMLSMTLISDFTSVLIDVRDNFIILPKPVSDKTFVLSRLLHILIHLTKLVLPMSLPGIIYVFLKFPILVGLGCIVAIVLATLFSIFFINAIYIIILKFTTPEKFKNIISYIQILFAILIYGSYQILPRIMAFVKGSDLDFSKSLLNLFAPPFWFASTLEILDFGRGTRIEWIGLIFSLVLPIMSIYLVIKYLAPSFNQKLSMMAGGDPIPKNDTPLITKNEPSSYSNFLAKILTTEKIENMGFLFTWKMTGRSRDFKLKVYPSFGYLLVIAVMYFLRGKNNLSFQKLITGLQSNPRIFLFPIYISALILVGALSQFIYSDRYKAAWIFFISPVRNPGPIILGSIKSIFSKFYLPIGLLLAIISLGILGFQFIPNLILAFANLIFSILLLSYLRVRSLPFSKSQSNSQKSGNLIIALFSTLFPAVLGIIQYTIFEYKWVLILMFLISLGMGFWVIKKLRDLKWSQLNL